MEVEKCIHACFLVHSGHAITKSVGNKQRNAPDHKVRCYQCAYGDLNKRSQEHGNIFHYQLKVEKLIFYKPLNWSTFLTNICNLWVVHQDWCQDPFHDHSRGFIEPLTCPLLDGMSARYCRKIKQEGKHEFTVPIAYYL